MAKRDLTVTLTGDALTTKLKRERDRWKVRALLLDSAITHHELDRLNTFMGPRSADRELYRVRERAYDRTRESQQ